MWDATAWEAQRTLAAHVGPVYAIAYHPAGAVAATAGEDGRLRLWDVATGTEVRALPGQQR